MIVRGEHGLCADLLSCGILGNGARNAHAVERACPAPDLVIDYQAALCRVFQDICNLIHLKHERGRSRCKIVRRANTGKYFVNDTDPCLLCRNK